MDNLKIFSRLVRNDFSWRLSVIGVRCFRSVPGVERVFQRLLFEKVRQSQGFVQEYLKRNFTELKIQDGPFKGLVYPSARSHGSALSPKLLGTYEGELAHLFDSALLAAYSTVVDVGCAEGYYAVGCAAKNLNCRVHAFDTNKNARILCNEMCHANGVADRVIVGEECRAHDLENFAGSRALILSDCEGAEDKLFTKALVAKMLKEDFIIEVHEHLGVDLSEFRSRFEATHTVSMITSKTDLQRAQLTREIPENPPLFEKVLLLAECRPRQMKWLIAKSKVQKY